MVNPVPGKDGRTYLRSPDGTRQAGSVKVTGMNPTTKTVSVEIPAQAADMFIELGNMLAGLQEEDSSFGAVSMEAIEEYRETVSSGYAMDVLDGIAEYVNESGEALERWHVEALVSVFEDRARPENHPQVLPGEPGPLPHAVVAPLLRGDLETFMTRFEALQARETQRVADEDTQALVDEVAERCEIHDPKALVDKVLGSGDAAQQMQFDLRSDEFFNRLALERRPSFFGGDPVSAEALYDLLAEKRDEGGVLQVDDIDELDVALSMMVDLDTAGVPSPFRAGKGLDTQIVKSGLPDDVKVDALCALYSPAGWSFDGLPLEREPALKPDRKAVKWLAAHGGDDRVSVSTLVGRLS